MVSDHLRPELPLDAGPALDVADKRVKAVFVMRPASFRAFGMDEAGLRQPALPAYIMVGAADTQAAGDEAERNRVAPEPKTIGTVVVAALAASAAGVLPAVANPGAGASRRVCGSRM
jgi:hypothetical protein